MRILFVVPSLVVGGIGKVTASLANKFIEEHHSVCIFSFSEADNALHNLFNDKIGISYGSDRRDIKSNTIAIKQIVEKERINLVINQNGLSIFQASAVYEACKGHDTKIITTYHNDPGHNNWIQKCNQQLWATKNPLKRIVIKTKRLFWRVASILLMHYVYSHSDYYMLLSKHYIPTFCRMALIRKSDRILVQNNPVTLDRSDIDHKDNRENIILYVGRLEEGQKRVSRILEFWKLLHLELTDWKLLLVGDGADRCEYEEFVAKNKIKNVYFEGFQSPYAYYKRASLFVMTSDYEGWPLVIGECKAYGCVPMVLGSYLSVTEIIDNERDGIIMPTPFDAKGWCEKILSLTNNPERIKEMSIEAEHNSHKFDIDVIYRQWESIFDRVCN